jgi:hypothetical protein
LLLGSTGAFSQSTFIRGDVDASGDLSVTDAVRVLRFAAQPGFASAFLVSCEDAADVDDSGSVDLADGVYLLQWLFSGGSMPPPPFPECGPDPTEDSLDCQNHERCEPRFYDIPLDFDAVFYVIDRSSSMQDSGELAIAKREVVRNVGGLEEGAELGIVFQDAKVRQYPSSGQPAQVDPATRREALDFVSAMPGGRGGCIRAGLLAGLDMALESSSERKALLYVGRGRGDCDGLDEAEYLEETLDAVTTRNAGRVEVHTVAVLDADGIREELLRELAEQNGGTYHDFRQ